MKKFLIHTCIVIITGFSIGYTGVTLIKCLIKHLILIDKIKVENENN